MCDESIETIEKCLKLSFSLPPNISNGQSHNQQQQNHYAQQSQSALQHGHQPYHDPVTSKELGPSVSEEFNSALLQLETYFLRCRMLASLVDSAADDDEIESLKSEIQQKDVLIAAIQSKLNALSSTQTQQN